jgi:5-methylcytosine-specific restriction endonuclease McrA
VDNDRLWLDVPFAEKDAAKRAWACWDPQMRRWYAPRARAHQLVRWKPLPDLLPGEDRNFGSGLFVDLVPSSCWFTNVRSCVSARDWDRLRLMVYRRAGHRCEACGATKNTDTGVYLEAHERWDYTTYDVQTLKRLVCLCTPCHEVTHFGLASIRERDHQALQHLMAVNQWQDHQAHSHVDDAFRLWRLHSETQWTLDITMLTAVGISVTPPPEAGQRRDVAIAQLAADTADPPPAELPPAGWYTDPSDPRRWRWWDGANWTAHIG